MTETLSHILPPPGFQKLSFTIKNIQSNPIQYLKTFCIDKVGRLKNDFRSNPPEIPPHKVNPINKLPLPIRLFKDGTQNTNACFNCGNVNHKTQKCTYFKNISLIRLNRKWREEFVSARQKDFTKDRYFKQNTENSTKNKRKNKFMGLKVFEKIDQMPLANKFMRESKERQQHFKTTNTIKETRFRNDFHHYNKHRNKGNDDRKDYERSHYSNNNANFQQNQTKSSYRPNYKRYEYHDLRNIHRNYRERINSSKTRHYRNDYQIRNNQSTYSQPYHHYIYNDERLRENYYENNPSNNIMDTYSRRNIYRR